MSDSKKYISASTLRNRKSLSSAEISNTWTVIANAIDEIYNRNASQLSFEELYRSAYNLVLNKSGSLLYEGVTHKINEHLLTTADQLKQVPDAQLLQEMSKAWGEHHISITMVRDILMYMDKNLQGRKLSVYELGLHWFRFTVWEHPQVCTRIVALLLESIAKERAGMMAEDRDSLKKVVSMMLELGRSENETTVYENFESQFLGTTQEFYHSESLSYLSQNTAIHYVHKATARLEEERLRSQALALPSTTEGQLLSMAQTELIERHATKLVEMENSGFSAMLQDATKLEHMRDMYDLLVRVPSSVDHLRDALSESVKSEGRKLIADQEKGVADSPTFVRGVLAMKQKYDNIVQVSFRNEKRVQKRVKESFEDFLNIDARAASCLAVYVDELLRVGLRGATEEQVSVALEKVIIVFRYLSDKDVFESFYKQYLAKRLLTGRSVSEDAEKAMVSLLKAECGYQFTTKLEGMFNDMRISHETRDKYKSHRRKNDKDDGKSVDLEVDVLTTGYWPSQNVPPCTLPDKIQESIDKFSKFYLETHTGRKLKWHTSTGVAELKMTFGTPPNLKRHELCVSTYQMCILLLFNKTDTLTLGQIRTQTHIPDTELRRHLISLCTPKNRILKKSSKGKGITSDDDKFTFNNDFTSKMKRVRIQLVKEVPSATTAKDGAAAATSNDNADTNTASNAIDGGIPAVVEEDRRYLVEAAIVRIMKARKNLNHNDLIAEVTRQLSVRFQPTPQFIKKRIESLIEREYLERSQRDHKLYNYVA